MGCVPRGTGWETVKSWLQNQPSQTPNLGNGCKVNSMHPSRTWFETMNGNRVS